MILRKRTRRPTGDHAAGHIHARRGSTKRVRIAAAIAFIVAAIVIQADVYYLRAEAKQADISSAFTNALNWSSPPYTNAMTIVRIVETPTGDTALTTESEWYADMEADPFRTAVTRSTITVSMLEPHMSGVYAGERISHRVEIVHTVDPNEPPATDEMLAELDERFIEPMLRHHKAATGLIDHPPPRSADMTPTGYAAYISTIEWSRPLPLRLARTVVVLMSVMYVVVAVAASPWLIMHALRDRRVRRRIAEGRCPTCAYPTEDVTIGKCPECGTKLLNDDYSETKAAAAAQ
jgi:hypothetical protein